MTRRTDAKPWLRHVGAAGRHLRADRPKAAEREYRRAVRAADLHGADPVTRAGVRQRHALLLLRLGGAPDALSHLRIAVELLRGRPAAEEQYAAVLGTAGLVLRELGSLAEAEEMTRAALTVFRTAGIVDGQVRTMIDLAVVLKDRNKLAEAKGLLEQAVQDSRLITDSKLLGHSLLTLGLVHELRNDQVLSEEYARGAAEAYVAACDREGEAAAVHNLGRVLDTQERYREAMECFIRSLEINREIGAEIGVSDDLGAVASLLQLTGAMAEAAQLHREALEIQRSAGYPRGMISSLTDLAIIDREAGRFADARRRLLEARDLAEAMGSSREVYEVCLALAEVHMVQEDYVTARDVYRQAAEAITDARRVLLDEADALAYFSDERLEALNMLVRLSVHLGAAASALEWAEAASGQELVRRLAGARLPIPRGASAKTLRAEAAERARVRDIEARLQAPGGAADEALAGEHAAGLRRLRDLEVVLAVQAPEYAALRRGERLSWTVLKELLVDRDTRRVDRVVMVEYFVTDDRTLVFGVTPEASEPDVLAVEISRDEIRGLAEEVRGALERDHFGLAACLRADWLGKLLAPIARWAEPGDMIYLVPHDVLHLLPLHAVPVGGRPLIERNPVTYTPSASVLRYCQAKRKGSRETALVVAAPPGDRPLIFARQQAHAVALAFGEPRMLTGAEASRARLIACLNPDGPAPDVLHFTTHGVFDSDEPMKSGIELADGRLTAEDILGISLNVDLVTLGACETGLSSRRSGDELIGLTRALLYAGAPSALLTLWRVDELSTGIFFTIFYSELSAGRSKAESLRLAQLRLRALTIADALTYARQAKVGLDGDPAAKSALVCDEARLLIRAGDPPAAVRLLENALGFLGESPESGRDLRLMLRMARLALPDAEAGPERLAFDDPYHWAPFILVGDWH